jgi:hypothetical protein
MKIVFLNSISVPYNIVVERHVLTYHNLSRIQSRFNILDFKHHVFIFPKSNIFFENKKVAFFQILFVRVIIIRHTLTSEQEKPKKTKNKRFFFVSFTILPSCYFLHDKHICYTNVPVSKSKIESVRKNSESKRCSKIAVLST